MSDGRIIKCVEEQTKKLQHKVNILGTCGFSVAIFACETWTLKKTDKDMILAFEMHCYRIILQVWWTQKVKNVEITKCMIKCKKYVAYYIK